MFVEVKDRKDSNILTEFKSKETKEVDSPLNPFNSEFASIKPRKAVGFFKLIYSSADRCDITILSFACLGSLIGGAAMPMISLLLGKVLNQFNGDIETANVPELVSGLITTFLLVGLAIFLGSYMMVFFWMLTGRRLINKINEDYFRVIMKQDQSWFDQSNMFEFATKVQVQIKTIESGIGNKFGQALMSVSQFLVSFLVGYITSWQLSLVLTSMLPLLGLGGWCMAKAMEQGSVTSRTYEKAGGMAEEVLYQIKTVASFSNFEYEQSKYYAFLKDSLKAGLKAGFKTGFGIGFIIFVVYCSYALAVGYGTSLVAAQKINSNSGIIFGAGDVITVLFSIIFGCFSLGQAAPNIKAIYEATYAAIEYFELKERQPSASENKSCEKPLKENLVGKLSFKNVTFAYPSKPEHFVLSNFTAEFEAGKKFAIVGQSGSGKSTVLSLIERFYDPNNGSIQMDDHDVKNLDLNYWRDLIGYVPQEPVLFNTTIRNNIIFGRNDVTEEEIREACEKAYAMEFIKNVGLDYLVGIKGSKLSGGQKQRIAIARAILKKPKLLILDEATSALDNRSEKEVHKALDIVSQGVTTIVIAHKITTIVNSDKIFYLANGEIAESGTHSELIEMEGLYYNMVQNEIEKKRRKTLLSASVNPKDYNPEEDLTDSDDELEFEKENEEDIRSKDLNERSRLKIERKNSINRSLNENPQIPENLEKVDTQRLQSESALNQDHSSFQGNPEAMIELNAIESEFPIRNSEIKIESAHENITHRMSNKRKASSLSKKEGSRKNSESNKISELNANSISPLSKSKDPEFDTEYFKKSRRRLMTMLKDHKGFVAGGMIAAACNGAVWPIYGILLADAIGVLSEKDITLVSQGGLNVSMMFLALAVAAALVLWMQNYFFYGIGELLTKRFRELIYNKLLNFHMGFFDRVENSPGSLLTKLSAETTKINGVALTIIGQLIQTAVTLILGISLAFVYQWKLCLINLCFLPLIIGNYIIQFRVQKGDVEGNENIEIEAGSILSESVINTKTLFSYNMQDKVVEFYSKILKGYNKNIIRTSLLNGLLYGASQFVIFGMYATLFYVGGNLFSKKEVTLSYMMRAIFIVLFTALGVGIAQAFVGDYQAAKHAIVSLYKLLDEPSLIDVSESEINGVKKANYEGRIEFRNVKFSYPTRPDSLIFNGLSFIIYPGQHVAFVGASGSGKSTIIALIERFYDVSEGEVLIDDVNIKEYDLKQLRKNIGIVMQEPVLFKRTIRENIKYGRLDASDAEILQAAKDAYIDTLLEESENKDVPISGGQKQRVAIARAILKNPKILLLDEATSALDSKSEEIVKASLDKLMKNRTSVIVAHRLSTIINCNVIFVLENGIIVELGTHQQLMEMRGKYYNLYNASNN